MSTVPAEIAGIGSTLQKLRVSPAFDPLKAAVGPEEYFVLSRIDGQQSLREVLLATGLPVERAIAIVTRLRSIGALLLPGEPSPPAPPPPPAKPRPAPPPTQTAPIPVALRPPAGSGPTRVAPPALDHDLTLARPSIAEIQALGETNDLSDTERRRILALARLVPHVDAPDPAALYALLGVPPGADSRTLKLAYFTLSKEIHPDRYYGKQLGTFADRLPAVFEATSRAYARLTSPSKASAPAATADQPQTPQEYAAELFDRACQVEVGGDALEAMKLFAAAVRVDPQVRYLRRAASCALAANQPKSAVEYAKKAHSLASHDLSAARLLAAAFRAAGKLTDAEEVLVMAMMVKSENDALTGELRNDLSEVRRLLQQAP